MKYNIDIILKNESLGLLTKGNKLLEFESEMAASEFIEKEELRDMAVNEGGELIALDFKVIAGE